MKQVPTYAARCDECGFTFDIPRLPDMAYGEFIVCGHDRKTAAYLNAFGHEAWDRIRELEAQTIPNEPNPHRRAKRLQWLIGCCLDPIGGVQLSLGDDLVCPSCGSQSVWYGAVDPVGYVELPEASFREFMALPDGEQSQRVAVLLKAWEQGAGANPESSDQSS